MDMRVAIIVLNINYCCQVDIFILVQQYKISKTEFKVIFHSVLIQNAKKYNKKLYVFIRQHGISFDSIKHKIIYQGTMNETKLRKIEDEQIKK